jgi:hypothetical protein
MSLYNNQTNITSGTPLFITRTEVINAFSTITGDLSGVNLSSFFLSPNPVFSSITMNPSGSITGGATVDATTALGLSSIALRYTRPYLSYAPSPSLADGLGNYQPLSQSFAVVKSAQTAGQFATIVSPTAYNYINTSGVATNIMTLNSNVMAAALTNISSINGQSPTTAGTTFTNLTGSNLTTTGTLTSPQIVSLSSINGLAYSTPFIAPWVGGGSIAVPTGVPTLVASIALPANYLKPNSTYIIDVPLQVGLAPPSPINFTLFIGFRLGSNGLINYQVPMFIGPNSSGIIQITGIATTNAVSVTTNNIDIVVLQSTGSAWTCNLNNPVAPTNSYLIKPI